MITRTVVLALAILYSTHVTSSIEIHLQTHHSIKTPNGHPCAITLDVLPSTLISMITIKVQEQMPFLPGAHAIGLYQTIERRLSLRKLKATDCLGVYEDIIRSDNPIIIQLTATIIVTSRYRGKDYPPFHINAAIIEINTVDKLRRLIPVSVGLRQHEPHSFYSNMVMFLDGIRLIHDHQIKTGHDVHLTIMHSDECGIQVMIRYARKNAPMMVETSYVMNWQGTMETIKSEIRSLPALIKYDFNTSRMELFHRSKKLLNQDGVFMPWKYDIHEGSVIDVFFNESIVFLIKLHAERREMFTVETYKGDTFGDVKKYIQFAMKDKPECVRRYYTIQNIELKRFEASLRLFDDNTTLEFEYAYSMMYDAYATSRRIYAIVKPLHGRIRLYVHWEYDAKRTHVETIYVPLGAQVADIKRSICKVGHFVSIHEFELYVMNWKLENDQYVEQLGIRQDTNVMLEQHQKQTVSKSDKDDRVQIAEI
eukprot:934023_1